MASGRLISNKITMDKKVNDLSCDTSRLAFTWLITFADREGRTYGDPAVLRSILFPRRTDITAQDMECYIQEWQRAGLINRYEVDGDLFIVFPNFDKNQPNLQKNREAPSVIPEPPSITPELLQSNSSNTLSEIPLTELNLTESKLIKEEEGKNPQIGNVFKKYQENIEPITPMSRDKILDAIDVHGASWVETAIEIAHDNGAHNWAYINAILKRWKSDGYGTSPPGHKKYGGNGSKPVETPAQRMLREQREREAKGLSP